MFSKNAFKYLVKQCIAEVIVEDTVVIKAKRPEKIKIKVKDDKEEVEEGTFPHEQWKDTFGKKMPGEFTVEAAGDPNKLSNKERRQFGEAFKKFGLDGNGRFPKVEAGLLAVTNVLDSLGFQLDMVSKDMIMGEKGSRNFIFRKKNAPGQDPYTEQPEISNSRIVFSWENLSQEGQTPKYEILAYAS